MTEKASDAATLEAQPTADDTTTPPTASKAFWASVGIGSAALAAALIYAKRPKKKK